MIESFIGKLFVIKEDEEVAHEVIHALAVTNVWIKIGICSKHALKY
jgi:hypothetical protein